MKNVKEIKNMLNDFAYNTINISNYQEGVVTTAENILSYIDKEDADKRLADDEEYLADNFTGDNFQWGASMVFNRIKKLF